MNHYKYAIGQGLTQLEQDPLTVQPEHCPWEQHLKSNGYYSFGDTLGDEHMGWSLTMRSVDDKAVTKPEYPYLVEINASSDCQLVFCSDFFSAADLMRQYAPLVTASLISQANESLESRLNEEWKRTEGTRQRERATYSIR